MDTLITLLLPYGWTPPENFTLESDFSPNPTGKPIHTLIRNRDRARILVDFDADVCAPGDLNAYFPEPQSQNQTADPLNN